MVATGDKDGHIGLWRVEGGGPVAAPAGTSGGNAAAAADDDDDGGVNDGVFLFRPHAQYVCGLKWARSGAPRLLSASYDGSVRCLDAAAGQWVELYEDPDGEEFSAFDCDAAGAVAFVGGKGGEVTGLDLRAGKATSPAVAGHDRRVNTVHLDPVGGNLLASSAGDSFVCGAPRRPPSRSPTRLDAAVGVRALSGSQMWRLRDDADGRCFPRACAPPLPLAFDQCGTFASSGRGRSRSTAWRTGRRARARTLRPRGRRGW